MTAEVEPVTHGWEALLDKHVALAKNSLSTGDFGINNALIAADIAAGIDHTVTFNRFIASNNIETSSEDQADEIHKINAQTVDKGTKSYEDFSNTVEGLKGTTADKQQWEKTINDAATTAKQASVEAIDDSANGAKAIINQLSEAARWPAANVFTNGLKAVTDFFAKIWTQLKAVAKAVDRFFSGIWTRLEEAWIIVKNAAETAVKWIWGDFSHQPPPGTQVLFSLPNPDAVETFGVAAANVQLPEAHAWGPLEGKGNTLGSPSPQKSSKAQMIAQLKTIIDAWGTL